MTGKYIFILIVGGHVVSLIKDAFRPHSHLLSADAKIGGKNLVCCSDIALDLKLIFFFEIKVKFVRLKSIPKKETI